MLTIGAFAKESRLSPKALRLYDELGLIVPARVDPFNGYRMYEPEQLERARLVGLLRRLGMPLARIRVVCDLDQTRAAAEISAYWAEVAAKHAQRADLVAFLVEQLTGKDGSMYEVHQRDLPERVLLTATRHVTADQVGGFTMELINRLAGMPALDGIHGAPFLLFHGEVSADSDGPAEFCRPVPAEMADALHEHFPDLTVRTDPAHSEAYVRLTAEQLGAAGALRAMQALGEWAGDREFTGPPRQLFYRDPRTAGKDEPVSDLAGPF
ncbi:MerR family transcriptional regulator [Nonomuraea sediminis]|uniref:MerR family transcriptional regulator n=1 Tax=Nonomuraea sediminis TaxID=2835864 RepID=UPI001BDD5C04|nr:helix-turn-helix domain-containing protein [Nonomuraea sediminis]